MEPASWHCRDTTDPVSHSRNSCNDYFYMHWETKKFVWLGFIVVVWNQICDVSEGCLYRNLHSGSIFKVNLFLPASSFSPRLPTSIFPSFFFFFFFPSELLFSLQNACYFPSFLTRGWAIRKRVFLFGGWGGDGSYYHSHHFPKSDFTVNFSSPLPKEGEICFTKLCLV